MTGSVTVLPDPHFPISDAARQTRDTAVMSVYGLLQQLGPSRDALLSLSSQIAAMRANAGAAGEAARVLLERVAAQVSQQQNQLTHIQTDAATLQDAMDGYAGVPTVAQLSQLDWIWEDAAAEVAAVNRLIQQDLPPLYGAMGGARGSEIQPVPPLVRR
jgi:hypothetical protein